MLVFTIITSTQGEINELIKFIMKADLDTDRNNDRLGTNDLQQATKLQIRELSFNNQNF